MKHYRIKEIVKGEEKLFYIQYTKSILFGLLFYWKKYNSMPYKTYDDAFNEVKRIVNPQDYENLKVKDTLVSYHYIDAFRLFRTSPTNRSTNFRKKEATTESKINRSVFISKG